MIGSEPFWTCRSVCNCCLYVLRTVYTRFLFKKIVKKDSYVLKVYYRPFDVSFRILGNRVAELEKKLKTLEVAGLWSVSGSLYLIECFRGCDSPSFYFFFTYPRFTFYSLKFSFTLLPVESGKIFLDIFLLKLFFCVCGIIISSLNDY